MLKTPSLAALLVGYLLFGVVRASRAQDAKPPTPQSGQAWNLPASANLKIELLWIPPGSFTMGSPETEPMSKSDERPQRKITLTKGFWLGKTLFTIGQWKAVTGLDVRGQLVKVISDDTLYDLGGKKQTIRDFMKFKKEADPGQYLSGEAEELP